MPRREIFLLALPNILKESIPCTNGELQAARSLYRRQSCTQWSVSLFKRFFAEGNPTVSKVSCDGSLFSPFLFGKYFDPSDAFPLWEFDSDVLLANLRSSGKTSVDWFQTDDAYVLKAELPGAGKTTLRIYIEKGKIVEISGQWKPHQREPQAKDWRRGHWWEQGYVRRLEFPEDAEWRKIEAFVSNDSFLELKIPMNTLECDASQRNNAARGTSVSVQV